MGAQWDAAAEREAAAARKAARRREIRAALAWLRQQPEYADAAHVRVRQHGFWGRSVWAEINSELRCIGTCESVVSRWRESLGGR